MKRILAILAFAFTSAHADLADKLSRFEGYAIVKVGTITGWQNADGKRGDAFEGCEHGRRLFIDNSLQVTCSEYFYEYAYRPVVVILAKNGNFKMVIGDDVRDIQR